MQQQRSFPMFSMLLCLLSMKAVYSLPVITRCSGKAANMIFVLDSSSSVWIVDYKIQLNFVEQIVEQFDIGPEESQVHVAAITFSSNAHLEFSLDKYTDKGQLINAISSIPYRQGQTNTAEALDILRTEVTTHKTNSSAPFIAVVVTDGMSSDTEATKKQAKKLHELGVNVYAIGVGYYYHLSELNRIASRPENVYTVSSYSSLERIVKRFNIKTCKDFAVTTPGPAITPTTAAPITTTTPVPIIYTTYFPSTPPPTTTTTPVPATTTTTPAPTTTTTTPPPTTTTTTPPPTTTTTTPPPTTTTTTPPPTTTTTTPAPTTTTTTPSPTTTFMTLPPTIPTTTTPIPPPTTTTEVPSTTTPEALQRDDTSTVSFGYDLVSMGAYRAHMIQEFINNLLPYTDYGHFGVVSYAYCPENFNVPVTSLMGKKPTDAAHSVTSDNKFPTLADVVRQMRNDFDKRAVKKADKYHVASKVAVLFVDPSVTVITPDLVNETDKMKKDGSKIFLVSVGQNVWHQPQSLESISSQPSKKYIFNYPTYDQLLSGVKHNPFQFSTMCNKDVPTKQ